MRGPTRRRSCPRAPRRDRARSRSRRRAACPATTCVSRDWFPPVRKTPVASERGATTPGSSASIALLGPDAGHRADAQAEEELAVGLRRGVAQRGGRRDHHDVPVGAAREVRERAEDHLVAEPVLRAADHHHGAGPAHGPKGPPVRHGGKCIRRPSPPPAAQVCSRALRSVSPGARSTSWSCGSTTSTVPSSPSSTRRVNPEGCSTT